MLQWMYWWTMELGTMLIDSYHLVLIVRLRKCCCCSKKKINRLSEQLRGPGKHCTCILLAARRSRLKWEDMVLRWAYGLDCGPWPWWERISCHFVRNPTYFLGDIYVKPHFNLKKRVILLEYEVLFLCTKSTEGLSTTSTEVLQCATRSPAI